MIGIEKGSICESVGRMATQATKKAPSNRKKNGLKGKKPPRKEQPKQKKAFAEIEEILKRYAELTDEVRRFLNFPALFISRSSNFRRKRRNIKFSTTTLYRRKRWTVLFNGKVKVV